MADLAMVPGEGVLRGTELSVGRDYVLRRLQMRPGGLPRAGAMREMFENMLRLGTGIIEPMAVYATFGIELRAQDEVSLGSTALRIRSRDVASLLESCKRATLVAATIGRRLSSETEALMAEGRMTEAMILDAFGSEAVEELVNMLCVRIGRVAESEGLVPTRRFSPGYGDWGLGAQRGLLQAVGAERIGIGVNEACILVPEKSVTAIVGWRLSP